MDQKETIIVTTDFSEDSKRAFPIAIKEAKLRGLDNVRIIVLSALEDQISTNIHFGFGLALTDAEGTLERIFKEATQRLQNLTKEHFKNLPAEAVLIPASGTIHHSIIEFAKDEEASLIVIATHGRTGAHHLFIGSVAERVVRESACAVLVVPVRKES